MPPWRSIFEDTESDYVFFDELKEIPRRFPDIGLALLHLGGTMFFGMLMVTMDPKQGVEVIRLVEPKTAIPIHYDDYTAFEFALGDTARPTTDPPEWWDRTQITSFDEFITQTPVMKYNRGLMMAILHDRIKIAKAVNRPRRS